MKNFVFLLIAFVALFLIPITNYAQNSGENSFPVEICYEEDVGDNAIVIQTIAKEAKEVFCQIVVYTENPFLIFYDLRQQTLINSYIELLYRQNSWQTKDKANFFWTHNISSLKYTQIGYSMAT